MLNADADAGAMNHGAQEERPENFWMKLKWYLETDIWEIWSSKLPKRKVFPISMGRIFILTVSKFCHNNCKAKAASLTFLTLLSVVPIVALLLGILRGFNLSGVEQRFKTYFVGQEQVADFIIRFAEATLQSASGGLVTGIGIGMLLWTALRLLSNIERCFNEMWGIRRGRTLLRKISDYLTLLLLCPVIAVALISICAFGVSQMEIVLKILPGHHYLIPLLRYVTPLVLAWISFFFLYLFIPNTTVKIKAALLSGLFTGAGYIILQYVYMYLQKILTSYNTIYGGFAALPFFLVWLQSSWTLILFGAQLTFSIQNVNSFEFYPTDRPICMRYFFINCIRIMRTLGHRIQNHEGPVAADKLAVELQIPIRITRRTLSFLAQAGLVFEAVSPENRNENLYFCEVPFDEMKPMTILKRIINAGFMAYSPNEAQYDEEILRKLSEEAEKSPANRNLMLAKDQHRLSAGEN